MTASDDLARRMREAAETIRQINRLYDYNPDYGFWNPTDLYREAAVVETVDDDEIESAVRT